MNQHQEYKIAGTSVYFPCKPYPSQFSMMDKIIKGIERRQNCLLESPTGSGKSLALLCSSLAWQAAEKAKKDLEEAEEAEKAACTCECHSKSEAEAKEGTSLPKQDAEAKPEGMAQQMGYSEQRPTYGWPSFDFPVNEDDDFKNDGKNFSLPSDKKGPRNHITISYEDDHGAKSVSEKAGEAASSSLQGQKSSDTGSVCSLCACDTSNSAGKVKIKIPKIYFGTRTHKQVAQIVKELRKTAYHDVKMTILGSREHTCIHPEVSHMKNKNDGCKELLNDQGCRFKDATLRLTSQRIVKDVGLSTAWDLEDLVGMCKSKRACPYFLSRGLKEEADLIICPYNYLVDPMVRDAMQINLKGHVVILDEAHNIEDSAREAASQSITQDSIIKAIQDIESLIEENIKLADHSKLRSMLKNLDTFIDENKNKLEQRDFDKSYKIWSGFYIVAQLESLGLGPKHYPELKAALASVKADAEERKEEAMKAGLNLDLVAMKPSSQTVLEQMFQIMEYLYRADLKYVDDYRASLVQSFSYVPIANNGQWLNSRSRHGGRNMVQTETHTLNFWCMNPGVAFSDFAETRSIVLTSGTLSPLASFESELGLEFKIQLEANHVIKDSQVWVGTIGQGPTGSSLQAVFRNLETFTFQDELGGLVLKVCETVPHGVLCFLPSYKVLEKLMTRWESTGLLQKIGLKKRIITEPRGSDKMDFEEQMKMFYEATRQGKESGEDMECSEEEDDSRNGAVFFAVCRGKVSEGLDFADNFARAVITVGIPYPNFKDVQVELKRKYNDQHKHKRGLLSGHEWYEIQAFRALNQALGRCIRHRNDWGALIIVDERFIKSPAKYCKGLSKWVRNKIQTFQDFPFAMDSLSEFTTGRLEAQGTDSSLETSIVSTPATSQSPRKPLNTISNKATLGQRVQSPLEGEKDNSKTPQRNFSIFNLPSVKQSAPTSLSSTKESHVSQDFANSSLNSSNCSLNSMDSRKTPNPGNSKSSNPATPSAKLSAKLTAANPAVSTIQASSSLSAISAAETSGSTHLDVNFPGGSAAIPATSQASKAVLPTLMVLPPAPNSTVTSHTNQESQGTCMSTSAALSTNTSLPTNKLQGESQTVKSASDILQNIASRVSSSSTAVAKSEEPNPQTSSWTTTPPPTASSDKQSKVQLRIVTERASPGVRFRVFEIPAHLHAVFGGNLNLPVSTTERLVYLVDPPSGVGENPTAKLIRMSEEEKDAILKTQSATSQKVSQLSNLTSINSAAAVANSKVQTSVSSSGFAQNKIQTSGTNSYPLIAPAPVSSSGSSNPLQTLLSSLSTTAIKPVTPHQASLTSQNGRLTNPAQLQGMRLLSLSPAQHNGLQRTLNSTAASHEVITIEDDNEFKPIPPISAVMNTANPTLPTFLVSNGVSRFMVPISITGSPGIPFVLGSPPSRKNLNLSTPNKSASGKTASQITSNKKSAPKQTTPKTLSSGAKFSNTPKSNSKSSQSKKSPVLSSQKKTPTSAHKHQTTRVAAPKPANILSPSTSSVGDNVDSGEEEKLQVRRKGRGKKRKSLTNNQKTVKKSKDSESKDSTSIPQSHPSTVAFKCCHCGHKLIGNKQVSDFQEQRTTPPFLRDASAKTAHCSGCIFFPSSTSRGGLQSLTDSGTGLNTKYVEQEEICVQFLYCGQCLKTSPQTAKAVGAQVQLAAGSGARFSKGQIWLFASLVKQEKEQ